MWSKCTKSCEGGVMKSKRRIIQDPLHRGKQCEGNNTRILPCNLKHCPGILNDDFQLIYAQNLRN